MITAVRSWLAIAVAVVALGGCAASSQVQEIGWGLIGQYGTKMSEQVKYDPYSARVYFDDAQMQGIFNEMVFAMEVNGCSVSAFEPYGNYDDNGGDDYFAREVRFDNLEWKRGLFDQLETGRGWGIVQSRYSEAAKHHGEYAVPIAIQFFIGWCGQETYGFYPIGEFIVRGKLPQDQPPAAPAASPVAAPAATPAAAPADAKTRLVKLKEMLDSGLINQQEYDAKRKAIIDSL